MARKSYMRERGEEESGGVDTFLKLLFIVECFKSIREFKSIERR